MPDTSPEFTSLLSIIWLVVQCSINYYAERYPKRRLIRLPEIENNRRRAPAQQRREDLFSEYQAVRNTPTDNMNDESMRH